MHYIMLNKSLLGFDFLCFCVDREGFRGELFQREGQEQEKIDAVSSL
jgi:hypothetical protein